MRTCTTAYLESLCKRYPVHGAVLRKDVVYSIVWKWPGQHLHMASAVSCSCTVMLHGAATQQVKHEMSSRSCICDPVIAKQLTV